MWHFWKKRLVGQISDRLPRDELVKRARVAIVDDEEPEVLADLRHQGISVDYLQSTEDPSFCKVESGLYDLLLLDYGGVGDSFGDQGLDVLRHLRRVNPGLRILAYTARTFDASKADFFRLADGVLKKDAGIRETLEEIESQLRDSMTPAFQWNLLCAALSLDPLSAAGRQLEKALSKLVGKPAANRKAVAIAECITGAAVSGATKAVVGKLLSFATGVLVA